MAILSFSAKAHTLMVRIADIEVYPQFLDEYIQAGKDIAATSIREEEGVVCLFPCQLKDDKTRFRILEIYASPEAYQHHIHTRHFLNYKEATKKMVKSLELNDLNPMNTASMTELFKRMTNYTSHNTMELTTRQQALVLIASMEAKGDIEGLKKALNNSFDNGLTVSEAKEALSQLYAYTGFPRSLNALGALQQVIKDREEKGLTTEKGSEADALPDDYNALKAGTAVQTQLCGGTPFNYTFAPQTDYYLKAHLFGDIFSRSTLSFTDRELVTIGAIAALPGCESQLLAHVSGSLNMGVTKGQLRDIPSLLREKAGEAEANRAYKAVATVLKDPIKETADSVDFNVWPKGNPNTAYAKYFIGNSYLADMNGADGGPANVTFEPRCRNNWHIHHKCVQVLICVAGRGWYQEWGKPAVEMRPGTVIAIPEGVKHWHGAARDSWFQHLTYMVKAEKDASSEWLEPVSDEVYDKLR
ncbi:MAG: carboxymuconolactone decarboxylase family protein [Prevotella sp.]|nr:carboxymuconolactone decarboxylase family protein [Prevotella sp.]